jgi:ABC-2 type transport system ATP-binding protein
MLKITNFSKSYQKGVKACDGLNLQIEKGDIFGFVGHNGAGKTTLLKSIAGILDFEEGEITFDGYSIKRDPMEFKKRMAYIPDNPDVYESLTGIQYLNFIGDVFQVPLEKRRALIDEYAKMFELESVLTNPMSSYSHGMKQKLVLISALLHEPELLILDEPFVGLDPKASFLLKKVFKSMCDRGMAIFFSTHVLEVVEKLCNKIAIIKKGKIVASGSTNALLKDQSLESIFMEINQN